MSFSWLRNGKLNLVKSTAGLAVSFPVLWALYQHGWIAQTLALFAVVVVLYTVIDYLIRRK